MSELIIKNFSAGINDNKIISEINLRIKSGEIHIIMGPNGSGKTTFAKAIMKYPKLKTTGNIILDRKDITRLSTDKKAKLGLFLQFQNPSEISDVKYINFLYNAYTSIKKGGNIENLEKEIEINLKKLDLKKEIIERDLNFGFSGGEKKKMEIMQMLTLNPKFAILDEPDSGLDVDAIKNIAEILNESIKKKKLGVILITHYNKIISYIKPDFVHVLVNGKIVASGKKDIAKEIEREGFGKYIKK
ncbi:MAG: Fe-S cluster assembly ATPase SufC [Candidatus Marsarchaeota archaeon]|nr:Fe-S cluster assembly ATPase SufC [Candidatus Marsarchaeota archaeon]